MQCKALTGRNSAALGGREWLGPGRIEGVGGQRLGGSTAGDAGEGTQLLRQRLQCAQSLAEGLLRRQALVPLGRHILPLRHHLLEQILPAHAPMLFACTTLQPALISTASRLIAQKSDTEIRSKSTDSARRGVLGRPVQVLYEVLLEASLHSQHQEMHEGLGNSILQENPQHMTAKSLANIQCQNFTKTCRKKVEPGGLRARCRSSIPPAGASPPPGPPPAL